ncbi:KilA-N domain-containing protein [Candidatus Peregrinibacteria bacterium]|nr:KilA-N domain-containing protein [Candidatus Peregrinibacteria bacterium]
MTSAKKIIVQGIEVNISSAKHNDKDYISLTDMAKYKTYDSGVVISNWLTTKYTVQFMSAWEQIHNPDFNLMGFNKIKIEVGTNGFIVSSSMWIKNTNAIGIRSRTGRYGGTFAHKDIAFEFATWLSPEFKLFLIKEFQRLKEEENKKLALGWDVKRMLAKINYKIHTDAIKKHLIPENLEKYAKDLVYATEADLLNLALFGLKAQEWGRKNHQKTGNIRDHAAVEQLVILANLETLNAEFIRQGLEPIKRLKKLNEIAIIQMRSLLGNPTIKKLSNGDPAP